MKVPLVKERRPLWLAPGHSIVDLSKSLPFVVGPPGAMVHRVRSARIHVSPRGAHTSISCWCGTGTFVGSKRRPHNYLTATPPANRVVCATCEGRATGAGQLGSSMLAGRMVLFTPRPGRLA